MSYHERGSQGLLARCAGLLNAIGSPAWRTTIRSLIANRKTHQALGQFVRFGVTGVLLTALVSGIYWLCIRLFEADPRVALVIGTVIATIVGYFAHGAFSFRGHGARDRGGVRFGRFLLTNVIGLLLNYLYVEILVRQWMLPEWSPIPLFFVMTPALTFFLNRMWVFR